MYIKFSSILKKDQSHSLSITEIINSETSSYLNSSKRSSFMQRFESEHDNESQTLLRSERTTFILLCPLI